MHNGVHIRVEGLVLEKLLDRAVESGISFLSIARRSPHDMELWLDDRNARRFLALAERFSYRAVVLERRGSSAVRVRMRARWSVLVGLCVAVLMLWAFSTRIWRIDIEVEESRHAPIASIETALQELGIVPGVAKEAIDADTLEAQLYERTGRFFVYWRKSARGAPVGDGGGEIPAPDTFDLEADRDLVAAYDGIVVSVNAMAGTARVKPGDCVTAGQVLIAGEERLSAEKTGGVCALGEVVARTWSEGTAQAELYVEKRTYTGQKQRRQRVGTVRLVDSPFAGSDVCADGRNGLIAAHRGDVPAVARSSRGTHGVYRFPGKGRSSKFKRRNRPDCLGKCHFWLARRVCNC